jgi:hypothetical protein
VVAADGTLARGAGAVSATRAFVGSTGEYFVAFARNINDCVPVVTIGGTAADAQSGAYAQATVLFGSGTAWVTTTDGQDQFIDRPFHLLVFCAK